MKTPHRPGRMLVLEGPPGAGKTIALASLVRSLGDRCAFFTEPCLALENPQLYAAGDADQHIQWHLQHELLRYRRITSLAAPAEVVVCDRNHLGALAYVYATHGSGSVRYQAARATYLREIAPTVPHDLDTVILLVSVEASLARRGGSAELPRWAHWYDSEVLCRLREFYLQHAAALCPRQPIVIDTDPLSLAQTVGEVARLLRTDGLDIGTLTLPEAQRSVVDPQLRSEYFASGGLAVLGHPVTPAFTHQFHRIQMCEHGVLGAEPVRQQPEGRPSR